MNAPIDVKHLLPVWEQFRAATDIAPIRDEAHYARMTEMLEALLDETQGVGKGIHQLRRDHVVAQCLLRLGHALGQLQHEVALVHPFRDGDEVFQ